MIEKIKKIIRVVLYIRVSTEEQARHGYSIDSQKNRLKEYCKEKGYKIVDIYIDEGKSARTKLKNRKELLRLINDSKKDKFDRIVIWRLDRWFRNIADYYEVEKTLESNNIDWECSDEEYDTYSSNGRLYLNVKLSIAQNESDQTGDRIKFNFNNMIQNKRPIYGSKCLPLGLIVDGEGDKNNKEKKVIIDETTKHIVYDMFDNIEITGSIRKTLNYINEKYELQIHYDSMRKYLKNPLYCGTYRNVDDYCEAYIPKERFNKIQSLIKRNNKDNKKQYEYIFSGLVKCYKCGNAMSGCTHRSVRTNKNGDKKVYKKPYYRCGRCWSSKLCDNKKLLNQSKIEKWVLDNFFIYLEQYITRKSDNAKDNNDISKNEKEKQKIENKLERLNELYIDGRISKNKYESSYKEFKEKLANMENIKIEYRDLSVYQNVLKDETKLLDIYNKLNDENKRIFWSNYIDYIEQDEESLYKIHFK